MKHNGVTIEKAVITDEDRAADQVKAEQVMAARKAAIAEEKALLAREDVAAYMEARAAEGHYMTAKVAARELDEKALTAVEKNALDTAAVEHVVEIVEEGEGWHVAKCTTCTWYSAGSLNKKRAQSFAKQHPINVQWDAEQLKQAKQEAADYAAQTVEVEECTGQHDTEASPTPEPEHAGIVINPCRTCAGIRAAANRAARNAETVEEQPSLSGFRFTCSHGIDTDDAALYEAHVKAEHKNIQRDAATPSVSRAQWRNIKRGRHGVKVGDRVTIGPDGRGTTWQVWSEAHRDGYVWIVNDKQEARDVPADMLYHATDTAPTTLIEEHTMTQTTTPGTVETQPVSKGKALAQEMREAGIKITPETWAAAKAGTLDWTAAAEQRVDRMTRADKKAINAMLAAALKAQGFKATGTDWEQAKAGTLVGFVAPVVH